MRRKSGSEVVARRGVRGEVIDAPVEKSGIEFPAAVARPIRAPYAEMPVPQDIRIVVEQVSAPAPGAVDVPRGEVPTWLRLVGYVAGLAAVALAVISLWPGPPWQHDAAQQRHDRSTPAQHQGGGGR